MVKNIIKRDGSIVEFDKNKIILVVQKAYVQTLGLGTSSKGSTTGKYIAEDIQFNEKDLMTVENIQDIVINELYTINPKVAHNYQNYREQKMKEREFKYGVTDKEII